VAKITEVDAGHFLPVESFKEISGAIEYVLLPRWPKNDAQLTEILAGLF
jgi:hypothetical protein